MDKVHSILEAAYQQADSQRDANFGLSTSQKRWVDTVVEKAESYKAVLAVLITSLTKKIETPDQDVRYHKTDLPKGYSGRGYDTQYITPFLRDKFQRLAMKESGWLTRSLEQPHAFTLDFPGKIRNELVKSAFLEILNDIEENQTPPEKYLYAVFAALINLMETSRGNISLLEATHTNLDRTGQTDSLTIDHIIGLLNYHFFKDYRVAGASRLPVLAVYTIYEMLMELKRYQGKTLLPLKSHTTSDIKSRSIGDIEVVDENGDFFEAVEIKHNIPISPAIIGNAYQKFAASSVSRYYFLTTATPNVDEPERVNLFVRQLRSQHNCEVIIDSVLTSLKYYLRLLSDPKLFLTYYSQNLQSDFNQSTDIKAIHLQYWNELLNLIAV